MEKVIVKGKVELGKMRDVERLKKKSEREANRERKRLRKVGGNIQRKEESDRKEGRRRER